MISRRPTGSLVLLLALAACAPSASLPQPAVAPSAPPSPAPSVAAPPAVEEAGERIARAHAAHAESVVPVTTSDPQWGSPLAPVTVVIFSDFQCPFCARAELVLQELREAYGPEKLRFVWKHQPLPFHQEAFPAAVAAQSVFALGGSEAFWSFSRALFRGQKELTEANFVAWAAEAGVEPAQFRASLADATTRAEYEQKVRADQALANQVGAHGTPYFYINGVMVSGARPSERFREVIDAQLAAAAELATTGVPAERVYTQLTQRNFKPVSSLAQQAIKKFAGDLTVWKVPVDERAPIRGSKAALITIVEWGDFQCPFCARVETTLARIREKYGDDVRVVWRDNALPFHEKARAAAALAHFARERGGDEAFFRVHDVLLENQGEWTAGAAGFGSIAVKAGLDGKKAQKVIESGRYDALLDASIDAAEDVGAGGTPNFFINGRKLAGALPYEAFEAVIEQELEKARKLVAEGVPLKRLYDKLQENAKTLPPPERKDVAVPASAPSRGNPKAKIVVQVFAGYQCASCARAMQTLGELEAAYRKQVRIVWRNLPQTDHQDAALAAEAALEAFAQKGNEGFWAYNASLMQNQEGLSRGWLEAHAAALGLDMSRFKQALDDHRHKPAVEADVAAARDAGIKGTPVVLVNGYVVNGAPPLRAFRRAIERAREEKK